MSLKELKLDDQECLKYDLNKEKRENQIVLMSKIAAWRPTYAKVEQPATYVSSGERASKAKHLIIAIKI